MDEIFTGVGGLHRTENDFISGAADIFSPLPIEKATKYSREASHRPTSENSDGPFEFYLPCEGETYIDPDSFRLTGYTSLVRIAEGVQIPLAADEDVAPVCFAPGMAFQTKELSMNGKLVNYATQPLDNLKAYWENVLSFGSDVKRTILRTACNWIPDEAGQGNLFSGSGYIARKKLWALSARVGFSIPLQIDLLATDKFLPKNIDLHLKLTKTNDEVLYTTSVGTNQYKLIFHDLRLSSRRITMTPELIKDHDRRFARNELAIFPFTKTDIKFINIPSGSYDARSDNIYRQKIPNSAIVFFIQSSALTGNNKLSSTNFENFGVSKLSCHCNSEEIPFGGYAQDYAKNDFTVTYRRAFDEIGIRTNNIGNDVTAEMFKDGTNFYPFDFSPDKCNGFHDHISLAGNLDFTVVFKKATEVAISMIVLSQYDARLVLDEARNVVDRGDPTAIS
jgi:hypothetical protein